MHILDASLECRAYRVSDCLFYGRGAVVGISQDEPQGAQRVWRSHGLFNIRSQLVSCVRPDAAYHSF